MDRLPVPVSQRIELALAELEIELKVVPSRKTKLGDWCFRNGKHTITINDDLCQAQFFMTLIHELAHATTWNIYTGTVKPHGKEWKDQFRSLMLPLLDGHFPIMVERTLREHMKNPSARSGTCADVAKIMNPHQMYLKDVPVNGRFYSSNGLLLIKISKRRTKWDCIDMYGRKWIASEASPVKMIQ